MVRAVGSPVRLLFAKEAGERRGTGARAGSMSSLAALKTEQIAFAVTLLVAKLPASRTAGVSWELNLAEVDDAVTWVRRHTSEHARFIEGDGKGKPACGCASVVVEEELAVKHGK